MLTTYMPPYTETIVKRYLVFDDGRGNGYWFPCNEAGRLSNDVPPEAIRSYKFVKAHPENFERSNQIIEQKRDYREPSVGACECGATFELYDEYLGACECPGCGRWYNLFGQELNPPATWSSEDDW